MNTKQKDTILPNSYYKNDNVVFIAKNLLGKKISTHFNGELTSGMIIETEAYRWINDRASHAYNNRRTKRNEQMYADGGSIYVYMCYGIHYLLNIVTNNINIPDAILIRAIDPSCGIEIMQKRTNKSSPHNLSNGPGKVSKSLGINLSHNGILLNSDIVWIENYKNISPSNIQKKPRVGVRYAGEDAYLRWRFYIKDNPYISKK